MSNFANKLIVYFIVFFFPLICLAKDDEKFNNLKNSCGKGNAIACFEAGRYVSDKEKLEYLGKACQHGHYQSCSIFSGICEDEKQEVSSRITFCTMLAIMHYRGKRYEDNEKYLKLACNLKDMESCEKLFFAYDTGETGLEKSNDKAKNIVKFMCENNIGKACYALAAYDLKENKTSYVTYLKKSCSLGYLDACDHLEKDVFNIELDANNNLYWLISIYPHTKTHSAAETYCSSISASIDGKDVKNWRLPTTVELVGLAMNDKVFSQLEGIRHDNSYWTSTSPGYAASINSSSQIFYDHRYFKSPLKRGELSGQTDKDKHYVICTKDK